MSDLKFDVDIQKIAESFGALKSELETDLVKSVEGLASMTHAKTVELAREQLRSLYKKYTDNLEFTNPVDNLWIISLKEPALWIEEKRKNGFMSELLSGKSAKTSKDGKRYAVIPFEHSKNPSEQSFSARAISTEIKNEMKARGLNWKKIETDESGSPRLGRLHSFNVPTDKLKSHHKSSPGMGVSVYQSIDPQTNKARRDVLTFRVITEDHRQEGLWFHPGRDGDKIMDQAFEWAMETWEREVLPAVLKKYKD